MAWPPTIPPATRTNSTVELDTHPADHNAIANALTDIVSRVNTGPRLSCRVRKTNNTQTLAGTVRTVILFDTEEWDTPNMHTPATGAFVIPAAGLWLIQACATFNVQNNPQTFAIEIWQTGAGAPLSQMSQLTMRNSTAGDLVGLTGADILNLTAGQSIGIRGYNNGGNPCPIHGDYFQTHCAMTYLGTT